METDGGPFNLPPPPVSSPFYGYLSYSYTYQRKVETDNAVDTENRIGDLLLKKPPTNRLRYSCSAWESETQKWFMNLTNVLN